LFSVLVRDLFAVFGYDLVPSSIDEVDVVVVAAVDDVIVVVVVAIVEVVVVDDEWRHRVSERSFKMIG
jgi:hypothetical protein